MAEGVRYGEEEETEEKMDPTGEKDSTSALQKALDALKGRGEVAL